ncbi:hypothetical protein KCTC32516_02042 [Polaribacter huanghezhanensis]|uniref:hypothetical protein n=1 Tax=Polaribacter huanghezhanensis TaxID=1354726 RepID=UPI002647BD0B|nr:hypothetical protein [Polaribacter huanghezhanensis]WKD86666.1 hypothetical protein KCTC32516_02042 [Polaribacter huanghezhanensis]
MHYKKSNILKGALIYSAGDSVAALLLDEFTVSRLLGMMFIGATFYAFEIPNYFDWIVKKTQSLKGIKATLTKTLLAIAYFNPLWIARHLLFIKLFSGQLDAIGFNLLEIAFWSFLVNIPISFVANYIIQNRFKLQWRFLGSAIFSAIMAIYYALSETIFS